MLPQTSVVNPSYFVGFSSATIIASTILFNGLNTSGATNTISLLCGFFSTSIGVYLLVSIEFVCFDVDLLTLLATTEYFAARHRSAVWQSQEGIVPPVDS